MTGRTVLAEEMKSYGLINYIYPKDQFIDKTTALALQLTDKLPDRLQTIKQLTQLGAGLIEGDAQSIEYAALNRFYTSVEGQEKIQEFYKKSLDRKK
jgi:enoyl-CoA hydratase/carnithine racemase